MFKLTFVYFGLGSLYCYIMVGMWFLAFVFETGH